MRRNACVSAIGGSQKNDARAIRPNGPQTRKQVWLWLKGRWRENWVQVSCTLVLSKEESARPLEALQPVRGSGSCLASPRDGLAFGPWWASLSQQLEHLMGGMASVQMRLWISGHSMEALGDYSLHVWRALRYISIATTSNSTLRWCQSRSTLDSDLQGIQLAQHLPGMCGKVFLSHYFLKEEDSFLSGFTVLPGPRHPGSVCQSSLCPVSQGSETIPQNAFLTAQLKSGFGAQEGRRIRSWRRDSFHDWRSFRGNCSKAKYLLAVLVYEIIF